MNEASGTSSARERAEKIAVRVVAIVAVVACLADQPPRWTLETKIPATPSAPAGKALRVTLESSHEPTLYVKSGGAVSKWEDRATPRASWTGRVDYFVDEGGVPSDATIGDRCVTGGGLCSGCDPPPGAFVRIAGVTEVDIWKAEVTAVVPAGAFKRIDIEIDATREPMVVSNPPSSGACSLAGAGTFMLPAASSSPAASSADASRPSTSASSAPSAAPHGAPFAAPSALSPPRAPVSGVPSASPVPSASAAALSSVSPHIRVFSCWVDAAATITATIKGACPAGPCAPPAGESVAILRTSRTP